MKITLGQPISFCQSGARSNQEDARYPDSDHPEHPLPFFVVCDGVGGSEGGEIASRTVSRTIGRSLSGFDWSGSFSNHDLAKVLDKAYRALDHAANDETSDMATTLALAAFHKDGCVLAHIGDSRVCQFRPTEGMLYRSEDHSLVSSLVHSGLLSPDAADSHPQATTITRYMCPANDQEERYCATVYRTRDVQAGDYFFLCSDGVLEAVDDDSLTEIICASGDDDQKMAVIASLCETSSDNNTAFLIPILSVDAVSSTTDNEDMDKNDSVTERPSNCSGRLQEVQAEGESCLEKITKIFNDIFN